MFTQVAGWGGKHTTLLLPFGEKIFPSTWLYIPEKPFSRRFTSEEVSKEKERRCVPWALSRPDITRLGKTRKVPRQQAKRPWIIRVSTRKVFTIAESYVSSDRICIITRALTYVSLDYICIISIALTYVSLDQVCINTVALIHMSLDQYVYHNSANIYVLGSYM